MIQPASLVRPLTGALLLAGVLLLSGCVYLRLLELKHQIAAFDRHFGVQTDDGIRIICRDPVLLTDDVRWIGLAPEKAEKRGTAERWQVRWVKQLPPEVREAGTFDIVLELFFADDKLARVAIPERYFAVMPKQLLIDLLRSLGRARVDREGRAIEAQLATTRPDLPGIQTLLGQPTSRTVEGAETILRYRYVPVSDRRLARAAVFDMTLHFATATGTMLRWEGRTPVGRIGFNFEKGMRD
ncbi:hypothetical protein [Opitutus sp. ER46]|uniref:hypothetical protein n=1 Tax=Opitutus sp. ER46 TaxID=2161864 RepID=UPI000D2FDDE5|nr:hypothetical protein [Opitutus sp. ER46]PTX94440.1 hypothetical protein DB354_11890 [Opitutus sp. ER46]